MKAFVALSLVLAACNSVTVVPIDDEDAGDASPSPDAGADASDASDASDDG